MIFQKVYPAIVLQKNNVLGFCYPIKHHDSSFGCMNYFDERGRLIGIEIEESSTEKFIRSTEVTFQKALSALLPYKVLFIYYIYDTPFYAI